MRFLTASLFLMTSIFGMGRKIKPFLNANYMGLSTSPRGSEELCDLLN